MQLSRIYFISLAVIGQLVFTVSCRAEDLPPRKPGLWEVAVMISEDKPPRISKQCIDEKTDAMMMQTGEDTMGKLGGNCAKKEISRDGDNYIIDSDCNLAGSRMLSKAIVSGDFNSQYSMVTKTSYDPPFMGKKEGSVLMKAKWMGACEADQRPGDIIVGNGMKVNIQDLGNMSPGLKSLMSKKGQH